MIPLCGLLQRLLTAVKFEGPLIPSAGLRPLPSSTEAIVLIVSVSEVSMAMTSSHLTRPVIKAYTGVDEMKRSGAGKKPLPVLCLFKDVYTAISCLLPRTSQS